ncbi:hydroxymethylglutaryl-CoA lyase [Mycobacterium sp. 236(2023)]|uniref:hydroxymethylglutaryl-CoA lyase n=1 Tax=Mycobacterium sp. 236(2023) TaxID=3038163 RepID=UPI0024155D52|nr:hydroxymethylglutaryl-CoA lyase [Mycobacterium sp. 236(2023)]MDG4664864.1 hydroxymethylglutaryl-CoA lyase [Mycobacterium sp. 236(2023)]
MTAMPELPDRIRVVEVGLRDGLQAVYDPILATETKVEVVRRLIGAGVREIEAVSFAHPSVLPQLADAAEVMANVPRPQGVRYRGLVPNLRGAQRAVQTGLDEIVVVASADEEVSVRNQNRTTEQILAELAEIGLLVRTNGADLVVGVACAFFAPAHGPVAWERTVTVVDAAVDAGATGIYLAATSGMEHPYEMATGIQIVRERHPHLAVGVHLHNRNGLAMANAIAAMGVGADWLETAFGGLGGDMWFPGDPEVLGNAPTEDLVHTCGMLGVETGIDLARYLGVVNLMAEETGRRPVSFVSRGGSRDELAHAAWPE